MGVCLLSMIPTRGAKAFEVRPAIIDLSIPVGSSTEREITIRNDETVKKEVFFTVQKFEGDGTGSPRFLDSKDTTGLPSWLRVSTPEMTLDPGASRNVKIHIDVPRGAESGGYYAAIFTTERLLDSSSTTLGRRIATLFLVDVTGGQASARIQATSISQKYASGRGMVDVIVKNVGKTHGLATLKFGVERWTLFGSQVIEDRRIVRLLPGEMRSVPFSWRENLPLVFFVRSYARIEETGEVVEVTHGQAKSFGLVGGGVMAVIAGSVFLLRKRFRARE